MIRKREAKQRAKFFAEYLFNFKTIPQIELVSNQGMENILKEWAQDHQVFERRSSPVLGLCMHADEGTSEVDDCTIYINTTLCKTVDQFNSTLIHELLHYILWWQGYDSDDGEQEFESRLKALGLSSNYDVVYEGKKRSKKPCDVSKLAEYEEAFQESVTVNS